MIRPIIEYGDLLYDNTTLKNKLKLDNIQRKAAITCTGAYRHTESRTLLHELAWQPLSTRRTNHKLIQLYKIINGIYPQYLLDLISPRQNDLYNLRNQHRFNTNIRRTEISNKSFFPSSLRLWNSQPFAITSSVSVLQLKSKLDKNKPKLSRFNQLCTGKNAIHLTRFRLGLSGLNSHRHKYNFIDSPSCIHCHDIYETTEHFFFDCTTYSIARQRLFDRLKIDINIDIENINRTNLLNIILYGLVDHQLYAKLIQILSDYIADTKRFR